MTVPRELDADSALAIEQHAMDERMRHELQVGSLQGRTQIGARGAGAAAAASGLLAPADAVAMTRRQIVDVLAVFEPKLLAGFEHGGTDRRPVGFRGEERSLLAARLAGFALPPFRFPEIGQAIVPRPAAIAELGPMIVILRLATDVDQPVDRGRAADHTAARIDDRSTVGARIGLRAVLPGQGVVIEHLEEPGRDVNERVPVAPARLDQQDLGGWVLGEPVSQHAAGRARADDDVIRLHLRPPRPNASAFLRLPIRSYTDGQNGLASARSSGKTVSGTPFCHCAKIIGTSCRRPFSSNLIGPGKNCAAGPVVRFICRSASATFSLSAAPAASSASFRIATSP